MFSASPLEYRGYHSSSDPSSMDTWKMFHLGDGEEWAKESYIINAFYSCGNIRRTSAELAPAPESIPARHTQVPTGIS